MFAAVICILCVAFAEGSPQQLVKNSGHAPAACHTEPSLPTGHDFGKNLFQTQLGTSLSEWIGFLLTVAQDELIWKHLWNPKLEEQKREWSKMRALPHSSISCKSRALLEEAAHAQGMETQ